MDARKGEKMTWIPTKERLPIQDGPSRHVLVQDRRNVLAQPSAEGCRLYLTPAYNVWPDTHVAWMELPEPYEPPKPKRRERWENDGLLWERKLYDSSIQYREVLPGDPDPDVVLSVLKQMKEHQCQFHDSSYVHVWVRRIEESRSK